MKVTRGYRFESAHRLPHVPEGHRCRNIHGHTYRVEISYSGTIDQRTGMVVDFFDLDTAMEPILDEVDHHYLNEVDGLENPTVENIAVWISKKLDASQGCSGLLSAVRVYENEDCWAELQ
jgi:6-pyruvoyltetrahydropterin/6-carboxytetrahydropterin synthase